MGGDNMVLLSCDLLGGFPLMESTGVTPKQELAASESPRVTEGQGHHLPNLSQNNPQLWPALPLAGLQSL